MLNLMQWRYVAAGLCLLFVLTGCKIELYHSVPEREVNFMVAILQNQNIEAVKADSSEAGLYSIWVEEDEFSYAVELLATRGYPRQMRSNLADLFKPSGLVPTQFEEQVRYVYGLSEELSHTISLFDGVIDTRVHIALPNVAEKDNLGRVSIYIKYDQNIDFDSLIPQIKKLVSDSIERITYQNVEVLTIPAYFRKNDNSIIAAYKFPAGIRVLPEYYNLFITFNIAILLILLQAIGASIWFYLQWKKALAKIPETPIEAPVPPTLPTVIPPKPLEIENVS